MISMPWSVRPAIAAAASIATSSRPPMRGKLALACALLAALLCGAGSIASAQTVQFTDAQRTVASGSGGPIGIAVDSSGNLYFADHDIGAVEEIVAVKGSIPASPAVKTLASGFKDPTGLARDGSGNLYVADAGPNAVKEILAVNGSIPASPTIKTLTSGLDYYPEGMAVDGSGNVYFGDGFSVEEILAVNGSIPASPTIKTLATVGGAIGLAVDSSGNVFVADEDNYAVEEILAVGGSIPASPTIRTLYSSRLSSDSGYLADSVAVDGSGNVYFTLSSGTANEILAVDGSIPASPTVETLGSGYQDDTWVAVDGNGNAFVSDLWNSRVVELSPSGGNFEQVNVGTASAVITMEFTFTAAGTLGSKAVFTQGAPKLDFTDAGTGSCKARTAYTAGESCTIDVIFKPRHPGLRMGAAVLEDSSGNALATGPLQGIGVGPQIAFSPVPATAIDPVANGIGLNGPNELAMDGAGDLFITDNRNSRVVEVPAGGGAPVAIDPSVNGKGFNGPEGMAVNGAGDLFIADDDNNRVVEVPAGGGAPIAIDPTVNGVGLGGPGGVAVDGAGDLFIADGLNSRVVEVPAGGGAPTASDPTVNGEGLARALYGVAIDGAGDLFVADLIDNRVVEIPAGGGAAIAIDPTVNGQGLNAPYTVSVDGAGDLFIGDTDNDRVVEVPAGGGTAIAIDPTVNAVGLKSGVGAAADGAGDLFIADYNNNRVVELQRSQPPSLSFASTALGSTSADSPQTVEIQNTGNAALNLSGIASATNFTIDGGTTTCSTSSPVAAGASCVIGVDFTPTTEGSLTGFIVLTDNALNSVNATQSIALSGTAIVTATHLSVTAPSNAGAGTPFNITVTALDAGGGTVNYTGTVSFTSTDANAVLPAASALTAGVGTFPVTLNTLGNQTITATDAANSLTGSSAAIDVSATPPGVFPLQGSMNLGSWTIGSPSGAQTLNFSIGAGTTVGSIAVVTQGLPNLDFTNAAGTTCTATTYSSAANCTVDVNFTPTLAGTRYGAVVFSDGSGNVLATVYLQGSGTGAQVNFLPGTETILGSGMDYAADVIVDPSGNVYVNDYYHDRELKETWTGSGYTQSVFLSGPNVPVPTSIDGAGNFYMSLSGLNLVQKWTWTGSGYAKTTIGSGLSSGAGLAVADGVGNVYIADSFNGRVLKETLSGGSYTQSVILTCGPYDQIIWICPSSVAVDGSGDVFVTAWQSSSTFDSSKVLKMTPSAGGYTQSTVGNGMWWANMVVVDGSGNLFVVDDNNSRILRETLVDGNYIQSTVTTSPLNNAWAMAVDGSGNLYISDTYNSRVLKLDLADPPNLSFATTAVGSTSSDSPQTIQIENVGNAALDFAALSYPADFAGASGDASACTSTTSLNAGQMCDLPIDFAPQNSGSPLSEDVTLTDNALNVSGAQQSIAVSGTATGPASQTITFPAIPNQVVGAQLTLSATASSGLPVTFTSTTVPVCTIAGTTATMVATGTCTIDANQAGNGSYFAAPMVPQSFAVTLASQTITFPAITGAQYALTQITLSATASSGLPVTFTSTTTPVCTVAGATASLLTPGTCTIDANQAGNSGYNPAPTAPQSFIVNPAQQTITFPAIANLATGDSAALSATASSGLPVVFSSTTTTVCTVSGTTALMTNPGACILEATQAGNSLYSAASTTQSNRVYGRGAEQQTITFTPIPGPQYALTQLTLTASATSGLPVSFASTTPTVCSVSGSTLSLLTRGTCIVHAWQFGNSVYAAATTAQSFAVSLVPQTVTFTAIAGKQYVGTQLNLTATASSGLPASFSSTTPTVCSVAGSTLSLLTKGTCIVHAAQPGDSAYAPASSTQSFFVYNTGSEQQTIAFTPIAGTQYAGTQLALSATASSGLPVTFSSTTTSVCTVSGSTASLLAAGTCAIAANQTGNSTYAPAPVASQSFAVNSVSQTVTFAAIANLATGEIAALSATASSGLPVAFSSATTAVCTVSGSTATMVSPGTCILDATQAGNSVYAPASSVQSNSVYGRGAGQQTITFTPVTGTQYAGTQLTLSATATSGLPVSFTSTTPAVCSVSGSTLSLLSSGTCIVHAWQFGNSVYAAATTGQSFRVFPVAQTITFTPITGRQYAATQLTLTATATSGLPVVFSSTTTAFCSVSGSTLSLLIPGTCIVHATQPGNGVYAEAPPLAQSFAVRPN